MVKFALRFVIFILFLALTGEIFFRTVILASDQPLVAQEEEYKIMHFDPDICSDGFYTSGRLSRIHVPWHVNNYGFIADIDYKPAAEKENPRILVVGDSFITGFIIPWKDHVANIIHEITDKEYDVYSMGATGGMLIHYSQVVRYADYHFDPDIILFMLNDSDVESSIYNYDSTTPFNLNLRYEDGQFFEERYADHNVSKFKRIMRKSAIARYLWRNKNCSLSANGPIHRHNTLQADSAKAVILQSAANYCVRKLRSDNPDRKLIFVTDANRRAIYKQADIPDVVPESVYMEKACSEEGGYHLDLTKMFFDDYQENRLKFNWDNDYHWTPRAHSLVANSIYQFMLEEEIINN